MKTAQNNDSARVFGLLTNRNVLGIERPAMTLPTSRGPDQQPLSRSDRMAHVALNARNDSAQPTDPLIVNARLVNLAAEIDRRLAARKALRPARSAAAVKGWEARRGL
jgi:hypothetical protein